MTLEEKVNQMENDAAAIPRLGVPEYDYWSEGLHGIARSGDATLFPQPDSPRRGTSPSSTRSPTSSPSKRAPNTRQAMRDNLHSYLFRTDHWSPNINIFRDRRWGRGQETYGEDPFLTSRMGVAFVEGLQGTTPSTTAPSPRPSTTPYTADPWLLRHEFNVDPSPHDLEDTYLPAFRATIKDAPRRLHHVLLQRCRQRSRLRQHECSSQHYLYQDWGFRGFVTSDCGAIRDFFSDYRPSLLARHGARQRRRGESRHRHELRPVV